MEFEIVRQQYNSKNCIVCGLENRLGLRTRFYEAITRELIAVCTTLPEHQGYPNLLHGGVSSALLDETIGRAISCGELEVVWGLTIDLAVKFRRPVPYGGELKIVGRITADHGRIFEGTGELYLPNGEIAVTARGRYMKMTLNKITKADLEGSGEWGLFDKEPMPERISIKP
ncbi:MAG: PaaI family thioesterase [Prevotellaceae bacterium]|jgi:acyl-coenzyme A thioesterase PaaI-like protein|nr:PaaI family thioesterase [Prevotellaceae bacterium]